MIITSQYPEEKPTAPLPPESLFAESSQAETSSAQENAPLLQPCSVDSCEPNTLDTLPPAYDTLSSVELSRLPSVENLTIIPPRTESTIQKSVPSMVHLYYSPSAFQSTQSLDIERPSGSPSRGFFSSKQLMPALPACFSRSPSASFSYPSFPPMSVETNGLHLDSGFPETLPSSPENLHPFTSHDVTGLDWRRFLVDIKNTAKLSTGQKAVIGVAGVTTFPVIGLCLTAAIVKNLKDRKRKPAGKLVDIWNHYFFQPRKMEIILTRGSVRVDSGEGLVPVVPNPSGDLARTIHHSSSSSSSSSSSDRGHGHTTASPNTVLTPFYGSSGRSRHKLHPIPNPTTAPMQHSGPSISNHDHSHPPSTTPTGPPIHNGEQVEHAHHSVQGRGGSGKWLKRRHRRRDRIEAMTSGGADRRYRLHIVPI